MSRVFELDHVIVKHYLGILRNRDTDTAQFREALDNLGLFLAIEMTKGLATHPIAVETPLMTTRSEEIRERIAIVPVLRAGLALVDPFRKLLPDLSVLHLGMYRDEETAKPVAYYNKLESAPVVDSAIIVDPMLATGGSAISAVAALKSVGIERISVGCVIAAPEGIKTLNQKYDDVTVTACSIDDGLNDMNYIVPGLGDAGDRYFGTV